MRGTESIIGKPIRSSSILSILIIAKVEFTSSVYCEPTEITSSYCAGSPILPKIGPLLPTAVTTIIPELVSCLIDFRSSFDSDILPKLRLITSAPSEIAKSIALITSLDLTRPL